MNRFGSILKEFLEFKNISIKEFAERINTTPKNLIDILEGKISISQNMIYNISFITDIPVSFIENVEMSYLLEKNIKEFLDANNTSISEYLNKFKYKELAKMYGVEYRNENDKYCILQDIMKYLKITNINSLNKQDNTIFYKSKNDKPELLALWLERCYRLSQEQQVNLYNKDNIPKLVTYIKEQARNNIFNEKELINKFNENGIYLVIENDLPGSKIRGAFKVLNDKPAIYLTKKHKRFADIYFALLHELAHCKSDFNRAKSGSIISIIDDIEDEDYELRADNTALNWMIDDKEYEEIKKDLSLINNDKYVKSFVAYRLAKDKIIKYNSSIYQENNSLIK